MCHIKNTGICFVLSILVFIKTDYFRVKKGLRLTDMSLKRKPNQEKEDDTSNGVLMSRKKIASKESRHLLRYLVIKHTTVSAPGESPELDILELKPFFLWDKCDQEDVKDEEEVFEGLSANLQEKVLLLLKRLRASKPTNMVCFREDNPISFVGEFHDTGKTELDYILDIIATPISNKNREQQELIRPADLVNGTVAYLEFLDE